MHLTEAELMKWTSIEDRLPDMGLHVWLWADFWYEPSIGFRWINNEYRNAGSWDIRDGLLNEPTHWRLIEVPKPPEEA